LEVILKLANPLHILDDDLVAVAELNYSDAEKILSSLLDIAKGMLVSEAVICRVFKRSRADNQIFNLLIQSSGSIGVTAKMP
jgi:aminoglycoside N3'-acetyltransferase